MQLIQKHKIDLNDMNGVLDSALMDLNFYVDQNFYRISVMGIR